LRPRLIRAASTTSKQPTVNIHSLSATATPADNPNLTAALSLTAAGLPVFPAGPDKRPLLAGWQEKATSEEEQIRKWWDAYPSALPAIVVGRVGLVVIDCDRHPGGNDGIKAFNRLLSADGGKLADVPITKTANGGAHLFFKQPKASRWAMGAASCRTASMCVASAASSLHQVQCCRMASSDSPSMAGHCWPMPLGLATYPSYPGG
jgi:bifunctional DNA primase/polymerase-like protein